MKKKLFKCQHCKGKFPIEQKAWINKKVVCQKCYFLRRDPYRYDYLFARSFDKRPEKHKKMTKEEFAKIYYKWK